jgi:hypothetical protein
MPDDEGKKFVTKAELNAAIGDVIDKFCRLREQPRKFDLPSFPSFPQLEDLFTLLTR